jgi:hypothetical protein
MYFFARQSQFLFLKIRSLATQPNSLLKLVLFNYFYNTFLLKKRNNVNFLAVPIVIRVIP